MMILTSDSFAPQFSQSSAILVGLGLPISGSPMHCGKCLFPRNNSMLRKLLCVSSQDFSQYQKVQLFKVVLALGCRGTTSGIWHMILTFDSLISDPFPVLHILHSVLQSTPFPWLLERLGQQKAHSEDWREELGRGLGIPSSLRQRLCNSSISTTETHFLKS